MIRAYLGLRSSSEFSIQNGHLLRNFPLTSRRTIQRRLKHDDDDPKLNIKSRGNKSQKVSAGIRSVKENKSEDLKLSFYDKNRVLDVYMKKLVLVTTNRVTSRKNEELNESQKVEKSRRSKKLNKTKDGDLASSNKKRKDATVFVQQEDMEKAKISINEAQKRLKRLPPFDEKILNEARDILNETAFSSHQRKTYSYCSGLVKKTENIFKKAQIGLQTCAMTNMLPLALPSIQKALSTLGNTKKKIKSIDPTFDLSYFDSPNFHHVITQFIRAVTRGDPRRAYADWAVKMMYTSEFKPTTDLLMAVLILLDKIGEPPNHVIVKVTLEKFVKVVSEADAITLHEISAFSKNDLKLFFGQIVPRLQEIYEKSGEIVFDEKFTSKLPTEDKLGSLFSADQVLYSMLPSDDRCIPLNSEKVPPQLDLSDIISHEELVDNMHRQLGRESKINVTMDSLETSTIPLSTNAASCAATKNDNQALNVELETILDSWREALYKAIVEELHSRKSSTDISKDIFQILQVLDLKILIEQLINIAFSVGGKDSSVPFHELYREIEQYLFNSYYHQYLRSFQYIEKIEQIYPQYAKMFYDRNVATKMTASDLWLELQNKNSDVGPGVHAFPEPWPKKMCHDVSQFLVHLMLKKLQLPFSFVEKFLSKQTEQSLQDAGLFYLSSKNGSIGWTMVPCFSCRYISTMPKGFSDKKNLNSMHTHIHLSPHEYFAKLVRKLNRGKVVMLATSVPSLVPPVPWVSQNHGGYLSSPAMFMRDSRDDTSLANMTDFKRKIAAGNSDVMNFLDSVFTFSSVPWKINKNVLDVVMHLFRSGGNLDLEIPLSEDECEKYYLENEPWAEEDDLNPYLKQCLMRKVIRENFSLRMTLLYQLSIANLVKDEKAFWLPSNIDFRGRCYDIPPVFNHICDDRTRALFLFAQGKPLGPKGLTWLKLHLANLTGECKKMAYEERLGFIDAHLPLILDSARNPLAGLKWWTTLDEPFQALAACCELSKATKLANPEDFICHLPVHQDGCCNGLQHYAALGRDVSGAKSVNVLPSEVPQDVYGAVCDIVLEKIRKEKRDDCRDIAELVEPLVNRKVVKQTVMTQVYGVTYYGGILQIRARLKETEALDSKELSLATSYVTNLVFASIGDLFVSTGKIKTWLREIANEIAKAGLPVQWVTPLGLQVIQSYTKRMSNKNFINSPTNNMATLNIVRTPAAAKHKNAFPPNYIHSLDATHMLLTARSCFKQGVTFAHVHDCFWTHACDVDDMNKICREEFINLHKLPLLENFADFVTNNLLPVIKDDRRKERLTKLLKNIPPVGDLDMEEVKKSVFFFS